MGGMVGWLDYRHDLGEQGPVVHAMTDTMQHRGPDTKDVWISRHFALGHRGLRTSEAPDRAEPARVETPGGTLAAALTGELYNTAELRRDIEAAGATPRTGATAELLAHAYLLWGNAFITRLNGAFALALWDGRTRRLVLARDRMGVKPLYYTTYPGGLLFASEPKGILANPRFTARLDIQKLPLVLQPRLALPGETPFAGLHEVPPAHLLTFSEAGPVQERYWQLTSRPHHDSFDDTAAHVRELLADTVGRQLATGVPVGAMLSGGVDSTSVAALAVRALRERDPGAALDTFCVQFESDPAHFVATELRPDVDAPYAAEAAAHMGTRHHTLTASVHDLLDVIPATRRARDLPGWGQFDASMYLLFREMRRTCTVALTGEAADEVFGGYPYFFKPEVLHRHHFPWLGQGPKLSDYLSPELTAAIDPREDERARYAELLRHVPRLDGEDPVNARMREIFYLGLSGPLAVILDRKERMSMSLGLDVRVPFCDHRLVEYVWNVPWSVKSHGGVKGLLKAAMGDLLPAGTVNRRKSAYPHVQNPQYDQGLIREATWIANDPRSPLAALFDTARLNDLIRQIEAQEIRSELPGGSNQAALLIQLVEMHHWIAEYQVALA
ncbi:asparagine synthase (glutamine-hydrolyzing) [Streptomyces sp. RS10V-4]|uniref:asparagine synthase (glutamine-hydrolyzing) n=1 Tax=Streptomyces rhizoryzae TaxID=2932493 RepID=UPI0020033A3F|nr:asparagine synthase (glutamine-hydrolyzing) [Streptomyces rhizoryzae]MCK7624977.1 asparagine synthase (glutamine-hydrolyzing) [Streptomyces rhizoryzae]